MSSFDPIKAPLALSTIEEICRLALEKAEETPKLEPYTELESLLARTILRLVEEAK